jgi:hypothetical protein
LSEYEFYERLHQNQPDGYHFFTRSVFFGGIIFSSQFPQGGCILHLEKVPGKQLLGIWNNLSEDEKEQIYNECISAIRVMRSISVRLWDAGMHSILYDRETARLTLYDFEGAVNLDPSAPYPLLELELGGIFLRYKHESAA